jgi:hypothetical protein
MLPQISEEVDALPAAARAAVAVPDEHLHHTTRLDCLPRDFQGEDALLRRFLSPRLIMLAPHTYQSPLG